MQTQQGEGVPPRAALAASLKPSLVCFAYALCGKKFTVSVMTAWCRTEQALRGTCAQQLCIMRTISQNHSFICAHRLCIMILARAGYPFVVQRDA
jgi:hypothetical protein